MSESNDEKANRRAELGRKALTGIVLAAAAQRLGPEAQVAAAGLAPYAEDYFGKVIDEWRQDGTRRTEEMLGYACQAAGEGPEQFAGRAGETVETRRFTANATAGAFNTAWEPKVRALGRLLAEGLIADGDAIDLREHALPAMMDMERLHVTLLDVLVNFQPGTYAGSQPYQDYRPPGMTDWFVGRRKWTAYGISRFRPQLSQVLPGLLGTLQRHGLAVQNDTSSETALRYFQEMKNQYTGNTARARHSDQNQPAPIRVPHVRETDSTWSPTQFGDRVLSFYAEAAADE